MRRSTPLGPVLLAGVLLVSGLVGFVALWRVLPRTSNTSPLAALFVLIWTCTHVVTAILTWRGSPLAAPSFLAAIGLLLFPASFLFPGLPIVVPAVMVIACVGFLGYRYLSKAARFPTGN
jgi:hypothetical protein